MGLCIDGCHLGNLGEEPFVAHLDSGSDLTLLSEAALNHLTRPPCIHSVRGCRLKGVSEEAWVLKDLKVPLLLGEDFHDNYHFFTVRDDRGSQATRMHDSQLVTFPACFAPPELPSSESKSERSELQTIVASLRSN